MERVSIGLPINSLQMDIKSLPGIPYSIFKDAVMKSRGRCGLVGVVIQL